MVSRSIQAEGTFEDLKQNFKYDCFRRRGLETVEFELLLVATGHNLRKFTNRLALKEEDLKQYGKEILH